MAPVFCEPKVVGFFNVVKSERLRISCLPPCLFYTVFRSTGVIVHTRSTMALYDSAPLPRAATAEILKS